MKRALSILKQTRIHPREHRARQAPNESDNGSTGPKTSNTEACRTEGRTCPIPTPGWCKMPPAWGPAHASVASSANQPRCPSLSQSLQNCDWHELGFLSSMIVVILERAMLTPGIVSKAAQCPRYTKTQEGSGARLSPSYGDEDENGLMITVRVG